MVERIVAEMHALGFDEVMVDANGSAIGIVVGAARPDDPARRALRHGGHRARLDVDARSFAATIEGWLPLRARRRRHERRAGRDDLRCRHNRAHQAGRAHRRQRHGHGRGHGGHQPGNGDGDAQARFRCHRRGDRTESESRRPRAPSSTWRRSASRRTRPRRTWASTPYTR